MDATKLFRYLGGGHHRGARLPALRAGDWLDTALIQYGDVIEPTARESARLPLEPYGPKSGIPGVKPVAPEPVIEPTAAPEPQPATEPSAVLRKRSPGWYDLVIDGEAVNDGALRRSDADDLLADLGIDPSLLVED